MEKEYIDREEIIELAARLKPRFAPLHRLVIETFVYSLKDIPNAEVEPIKYGEWLDLDPAEWECSRCHYEVERWNNTLYCPSCGAKMFKEIK